MCPGTSEQADAGAKGSKKAPPVLSRVGDGIQRGQMEEAKTRLNPPMIKVSDQPGLAVAMMSVSAGNSRVTGAGACPKLTP